MSCLLLLFQNSSVSEDRRGLTVSRGSRPLTISIRLGGNKETVQTTVPPAPAVQPHKSSQPPTYRQLPSSIIRINYSRGLNSYIPKLKAKRRDLFSDLSDIRDDSMSAFPLTPDPLRKKCHYDFMLDEMRIMANDFVEERRWKINVAYILVHEAKAYYYKHLHPLHSTESTSSLPIPDGSSSLSMNTEQTEEERLVQQHQRIGHFLSSMVKDFWSKVHGANEEFLAPKCLERKPFSHDDLLRVQITMNRQRMRPECLRNLSDSPSCDIAKASSVPQFIDRCVACHVPAVVQSKSISEDLIRVVCRVLNRCESGAGWVVCDAAFDCFLSVM